MIPPKRMLLRPVLECASEGEARISNVIDRMAEHFDLTDRELRETLPSGTHTRFAARVRWAKADLILAGLVKSTRRAHFTITDRGKSALANSGAEIERKYLQRHDPSKSGGNGEAALHISDEETTPEEVLRDAHKRIKEALAAELLDRVREAPAAFFEQLIIKLLQAMGYGGSSEDTGRALGRSGDDGVDGVIDQDPLGVDQIYLQAKRYAEGNTVGAGPIRDFFGALSLKKAQKGIFVTTSTFSRSAIRTAEDLGSRIVLIDGQHLARLMIRYNIGCRDEDVLHLKRVDEDFFEQ